MQLTVRFIQTNASFLPKHHPFFRFLILYFLLTQPSESKNHLPKQLGNKTECALLAFLVDLGLSYQKAREEYPEEKLFKVE